MGDVSSAYTFFSRAVDIADAAADSVAPAVSSLMDVHSKTRAWSTSDAHRGLALCALARKEQDHPLVHAAKHLRRAITAGT